MPAPTPLLRLIGQALLAAGTRPGDDALELGPRAAEAVWTVWQRKGDEAALRAEVQALAQADRSELAAAVAGTVEQLAAGRTAEMQRALTAYLMQVPASMRRHLRRPADPGGTTWPAWLALGRAEDLLALLPARPPHFLPGDRPDGIGGRELLELLESDTNREVWLAGSPGEPVVLQFFVQEGAGRQLRAAARDGGPLDRVLREGRHPGLLHLRQAHLSANPPALEYEYFEAGDLIGLLRDWQAAGAPADRAQVARLVGHLAEALGHAHRLRPPLVHRDLRPAHVLVRQAEDGSLTCKVAGLGLGGLRGAETAAAGSSLYASPGQRRGDPPDPRDDVYALGVLWYQALVANPGAGRPGGSQWRRKLAEGGMAAPLIELLEACFEDDATYRPADAAVLAEQLHALQGPAGPPAAVPPARLSPGGPKLEPVFAEEKEPAPPRSRSRRPDVWGIFESLEKKGPELAKTLTNSVGLKLVLIPAGSCLMGAAPEEAGRRENEVPQHEVTLTRPFYLGVYPVTQEQYERVMAGNPSRFARSAGGGPDHPVDSVTWDEAVAFCRRLSALPAEREAGRLYRLPTEAEWEYACRAGTPTAFAYGPSLSSVQANFDGRFPYGGAEPSRAVEKTTRVGTYPANNFGLCDMHGNVWEWCADWLDGLYYASSVKRDPPGPEAGRFRVQRGGSWRNHAVTCRAAYRNGLGPGARDSATGFRVVLEVSGA